MVTDNEIQYAHAVLTRFLVAYERDKAGGVAAGGAIADMGKELASLPGAYAALKKAQADEAGGVGTLATLEAVFLYVATDNLAFFHAELAAFEMYKANPAHGWQEKKAAIQDLLEAFKRADDNDRISKMSGIHGEIVAMGKEAENPGEIYKAINEFANKVPDLKETLLMYIAQIRRARREASLNSAAMERLAGMRKNQPSSKDIFPPKQARIPPGKLPMCSN
ncbi:MAG: hypothetical protein NTX79_07060 [Candidatus Micrarchaeota archaeon]|nr:hypothetical protein [Candidatus Micrarchaeota archaeon]